MGKRKDRLGRADWLHRALEVLEERGVEGVRILSLAKDLGVTRGSFYWHFKDRGELLDGLLSYWEVALTDSVMIHVNGVEGDARERLLALMEEVVLNDRSRFDLAVLSWARFDAGAATRVEEVLGRRHEFVRGLFLEMGFPRAEADLRTQLLVGYLIGRLSIDSGESSGRTRRRLRRQWEILTAPTPGEGPPSS